MNAYGDVIQSRPHTLRNRVRIKFGRTCLSGELSLSTQTKNIVLILQQNSYSSYKSDNQKIAQSLYDVGVSTLIINLLTANEQKKDSNSYNFRFDSELLGNRLIQVTDWVETHRVLASSKVTYFCTGIDVAPALVAAAKLKNEIYSVITNRGRPDLVENDLPEVTCPTLLIVNDSDKVVLGLNKLAYKKIKCEKNIKFLNAQFIKLEESNKFEEIAQIVLEWLHRHHPITQIN